MANDGFLRMPSVNYAKLIATLLYTANVESYQVLARKFSSLNSRIYRVSAEIDLSTKGAAVRSLNLSGGLSPPVMIRLSEDMVKGPFLHKGYGAPAALFIDLYGHLAQGLIPEMSIIGITSTRLKITFLISDRAKLAGVKHRMKQILKDRFQGQLGT